MHTLSVPVSLTVYANFCPEAIFAVCLFAYSALFCAGGVYGYQYSSMKGSALPEFRSYDVTVPRIYNRNLTLNITAAEGAVLPGDIFVEFSAFHQFFTLQLILNKHLISPNITLKSVKEGGDLYHDAQNESRCYYSGHVVGQPQSRAAVSTCNGLRGYIWTTEEGFHLEPWEWSPSGRHYVFRDSDYKGPNLTCGYKGRTVHGRVWRALDDAIEQKKNSIGWSQDNRPRVVELYVANDYTQYAALRSDTTKVFRRTKDIVNILSSFYHPMNIYVSLVGVEVWVRGDRSDVVATAEKSMSNFLEYRRYYISPKHRNDNAQLITGRYFSEGLFGRAPVMTICTLQYSGGVTTDHSALVGPVAATVAHQIGHNLGLLHDTELCRCPDGRCIMAASSGGRKLPIRWSDCSKQQFSDAFHQGMDYCLHNIPQLTNTSTICGNGFIEEGEECDCGLPEDCTNYCCNAETCKFMANATCAQGACCNQSVCQLKPVTTECRPSSGECDLSEYCDGISEQCPSDAFMADGTQCTNRKVTSYCYEGKCNTRDSQCRLLWGITGRASHSLCFEHYNILGNASGNCGINWSGGKMSFRKCEPRDSLCGMLHCLHLNEKLMFWKESLAYNLPEAFVLVNGSRQECKGVILDVGLDMPDPGLVPNGVACGDGKICFNQQCQDVLGVFPNTCPDCTGHGVCNSLGQCHCQAGYAPPNCDNFGNGGSYHSGPILIHHHQDDVDNVGVTVGLCIFFLIILPLLVLLVFCIVRHRQKIKYYWVERNSEKYRSVQSVNICTTDSADAALPETLVEEPVPVFRSRDVVVQASAPVSAAVSVPTHTPVGTPRIVPISAPVSKQQSVPVSKPQTAPVSKQQSVPVSKPQSVPLSKPLSAQVSAPATAPPSPPRPSPALPSRPMSVVIRPNPPNRASQAKRASSITTQDISSPKFVSSTNINLESTLPLSKIKRGEFPGLKQAGDFEHESDEAKNSDEFQFRTLPNPPAKRGVKSNPPDRTNRNSCLEPSSHLRSNPTSTGETVPRSKKPHDKVSAPLLGDSGVEEENVYEEIGGLSVVCPKIPPPDPPKSEQKAASSREPQTPKTREESRIGSRQNSTRASKVAGPKRSDSTNSGSGKAKAKPGATDDAKGNRTPKKPRQSTGSQRSSQKTPSSTNGPSSSADSSNLRQPRVQKERTPR